MGLFGLRPSLQNRLSVGLLGGLPKTTRSAVERDALLCIPAGHPGIYFFAAMPAQALPCGRMSTDELAEGPTLSSTRKRLVTVCLNIVDMHTFIYCSGEDPPDAAAKSAMASALARSSVNASAASPWFHSQAKKSDTSKAKTTVPGNAFPEKDCSSKHVASSHRAAHRGAKIGQPCLRAGGAYDIYIYIYIYKLACEAAHMRPKQIIRRAMSP
jgi:hypothetical protein